jgi:tetratricopeptide (TPR) repeat protein
MAARVTKKELKEPDYLQVAFKKAVTFILRHRAKVYVILALHLLGVAIALGWHLYRLNYNKSALKIFNQVEEMALTDSSNNTVKLVEGFKNVVSKYPNSQAAIHSLYKLGNLYLNMNQIDLSLKAYDEFLNKASDKDYLKVFAHLGKGYCYETNKDFKKALASFETALKMAGAKIFEVQIHRDIGRVFEEMNDKIKSLEHYRKSLEKTTDPTMERLLKRKIAELA